MLYLKSCPRCSGDIYEGFDMFGHFLACVQCGYELTDPQTTHLKIEYTAKRTGTEVASKLAELAKSA